MANININITTMWTIQILTEDGNVWDDYITDYPIISEKDGRKMVYISGRYFGSSTRMGDIGTVFYLINGMISDIQTKHVRVVDNDGKIVKQFKITPENKIGINEISLDNDVKIMIRDLHRWSDYPCEISGICFFMDK
jgi:hypothetical protein